MPTIERMIRCAERELGMRAKVYPGRVTKGSMNAKAAEDEMRAMAGIVNVLKAVERGEQPSVEHDPAQGSLI